MFTIILKNLPSEVTRVAFEKNLRENERLDIILQTAPLPVQIEKLLLLSFDTVFISPDVFVHMGMYSFTRGYID